MISDIARNFVGRVRDRGFFKTCVTYGHMMRWKWAQRDPKREYLVRRMQGFKLCLSLRHPGISEALNLYGFREPEHRFLLRWAVKEGMCVLDIGGNIGYYTMMAAKAVGPEGTVYAVEPHPDNCRLLRRSIELNGFERIVEMDELAISDRDGARDFNVAGSSNLHSFHDHSLDPNIRGTGFITNESISVKTVTLETYLKDRQRPDFLRMDVEGHEVEILESVAELADRTDWRPVILFETHWGYYDAETHDIAKPLKELFRLGYKARWAASYREPAEGFKKRGYAPTEMVKYIRSEHGMYENIRNEDALALAVEDGQMRCLLLTPGEAAGLL